MNYEEDEPEYQRRINRMIEYLRKRDYAGKVDASQLWDWQIKAKPRPILVAKADGVWLTRFGNRLLHWLGQRRDEGKHTFVVFDGMIDAIAFEDNARNDDVVVPQVLSELERLAVEYDFTSYGILHPSRAGQRTGTGSNAPAWSTRPRAIQQVTKEDGKEGPEAKFVVREVIKRSHGPSGAKIALRYMAGFMEPAFEGVVGAKVSSMLPPILQRNGQSGTIQSAAMLEDRSQGLNLTNQHLLIEEFRTRTGRARAGVKDSRSAGRSGARRQVRVSGEQWSQEGRILSGGKSSSVTGG